MAIDKVYSKLAAHMIKGMMFHEQLANYYDFLGLEGYKRCHEYHFFCESKSYRLVNRYYINHHNKLIDSEKVEDPQVIPSSWFKYSRQDVDNGTRASAVKSGIESWIEWERSTKKCYEQMYLELIQDEAVASALFIKKLICDVDNELKYAERKYLRLEAVDYDMTVIIPEQVQIHDKYEHKLKCLFEDNRRE